MCPSWSARPEQDTYFSLRTVLLPQINGSASSSTSVRKKRCITNTQRSLTRQAAVINSTFFPVLRRLRHLPGAGWNLPLPESTCAFICNENKLVPGEAPSSESKETEGKQSVPAAGSRETRSSQVSVWWASSCTDTRWRALKGQVFSWLTSCGWFYVSDGQVRVKVLLRWRKINRQKQNRPCATASAFQILLPINPNKAFCSECATPDDAGPRPRSGSGPGCHPIQPHK